MPNPIDDYDEIVGVVDLYVKGAAEGDVGALKEAFHEDARMFGELAGTRYDVPIAQFMDLAAAAPADTGSYRTRIVSVDQVGDGANAVVVEDGYWGTVSFVTFLTLNRIGGSWRIVNKTFVHTGGEPPPH